MKKVVPKIESRSDLISKGKPTHPHPQTRNLAVRYVDGIFPSLWLDDMASFTAQRDLPAEKKRTDRTAWGVERYGCVLVKRCWFFVTKKRLEIHVFCLKRMLDVCGSFAKICYFQTRGLLWNSVDKRMDKDVQTLDLSTWRTWQKENWVLKLEKVVALDAFVWKSRVAGGKLCLYINTDFPAFQGVRLLWIFWHVAVWLEISMGHPSSKPSDAPNTWMAQSPKTKPPATSKKAGEHFTKKTKKKKKTRVFLLFFPSKKKRKIYSYMCTWSRNSTSIFRKGFSKPPR